MNSVVIFGALSAIFILIGALPYIRDVIKKNAHPHVLSWLGWGCITLLGASAMYADGSTWMALIVFANTIACFSVVLFSVINKVGVLQTTKYDYFFFFMGILGLILWQTLDLAILALVCAIIADCAFGLPTVFKTYKDPGTENSFCLGDGHSLRIV